MKKDKILDNELVTVGTRRTSKGLLSLCSVWDNVGNISVAAIKELAASKREQGISVSSIGIVFFLLWLF